MAMDWMIRAATSRMRVRGGGKPLQAPVFNSDSASRRKAIAGSREGMEIKARRVLARRAPAQLCLNLVPVGERHGSREGLVTKSKQGMVTGQINHNTNGNCGASLQHSRNSVRAI